MKTLTINLAKKYLILDYENKEKLHEAWDFYKAFNLVKSPINGFDCNAIFMGTFMTEEDYRSLISDEDGGISIYKHPKAYLVSYSRHKNAFKDLIEKEGYYWLENPLGELQTCCSGRDCGCMGMPVNVSSREEMNEVLEAESRTLKYPIIFEILE